MLQLDHFALSSTQEIPDLGKMLTAKGWKLRKNKEGKELQGMYEKPIGTAVMLCHEDEYAGKPIVRIFIHRTENAPIKKADLLQALEEIGYKDE